MRIKYPNETCASLDVIPIRVDNDAKQAKLGCSICNVGYITGIKNDASRGSHFCIFARGDNKIAGPRTDDEGKLPRIWHPFGAREYIDAKLLDYRVQLADVSGVQLSSASAVGLREWGAGGISSAVLACA